MKRFCAANGVLTGHGINDEIDLIRADCFIDAGELGHQFLIDRKSASGVEHDNRNSFGFCLCDSGLTHGDRIPFAIGRVYRNVDLTTQYHQLLDGSGALQVGGYHHHAAALFLNLFCEFCA